MYKSITIYTDGGARGNPGPAGIGVVVYDGDGRIINKISHYIGKKTNNQAEYQALIAGLNEAIELKAEAVKCFLDSELVMKQMRGEYKVKNENIKDLYLTAQDLAKKIAKVSFHHVPREKNKEADLLVNKAINRVLQ